MNNNGSIKKELTFTINHLDTLNKRLKNTEGMIRSCFDGGRVDSETIERLRDKESSLEFEIKKTKQEISNLINKIN